MDLAHALLGDVTAHAELARELAELLALELGADGDAGLLGDGVDEGLVVVFVAVVGKEDELGVAGLDGLDGLSVARY